MKNWIVVLLIFVLPLGLYAYLDAKAQNDMMCKVEGQKQSAKTPKAKVIKFSSPMCSECKEVAVEMDKAMKNYKGSVVVEEINVVENVGKGVEYNKSQIKKYKVSLVPTLIFVDRSGNVIHRQEGTMSSDEIIDVLEMIDEK